MGTAGDEAGRAVGTGLRRPQFPQREVNLFLQKLPRLWLVRVLLA